ncbi:MAG: oligosaccharide flippase family protein [Aeromonas sp.]
MAASMAERGLKNNRSLKNNIVALIFVQSANYLAPLLVLPHLSRTLGVQGFGDYALLLSLCSLAFIITDYGFGLSAPYWLAKHKQDKARVAEYMGAIFMLKLLLLAVCAGAVLAYLFYTQSPLATGSLPWLVLACIALQGYQINWFFIGIEQMRKLTYSALASKLAFLFFVLAVVDGPEQLSWVLWGLALSHALTTAVGLYFFHALGFYFRRAPGVLCRELVKDSALFFLSRVAVSVYTSASTLIIATVMGSTAAGLYNSAEKLYQAGQNLTSPLSQALYPYLTRTQQSGILYRLLLLALLPLCFFCGLMSTLAPEILSWFFGPAYAAAGPLLQIFFITLIVNFISVNFGYPAFASLGRVDVANKSVLVAAVLQAISLLWLYLSAQLSALSICWSVLAVESVVMLLRVGSFIYLSRRALVNSTRNKLC